MNTTSPTSGKSLGITSMVIGIITLLWSFIPFIGAWALWIAIIGLIFGLVGFFLANKGNNPKKGIIITGVALCLLASGISWYWSYQTKKAAEAIVTEFGNTN